MVFKSKYLQSVYDKTVEKNPVQLERCFSHGAGAVDGNLPAFEF